MTQSPRLPSTAAHNKAQKLPNSSNFTSQRHNPLKNVRKHQLQEVGEQGQMVQMAKSLEKERRGTSMLPHAQN